MTRETKEYPSKREQDDRWRDELVRVCKTRGCGDMLRKALHPGRIKVKDVSSKTSVQRISKYRKVAL